MTRTTREFGVSTVAALAIGLSALPASAQTRTPALPSTASDAVWAQYLSASAPATSTTASTEESGDRLWKRYGIGAAAVGAGGIFSFYVANALSSGPRPVAGIAAPVAPVSSDPGPVVNETGKAATQGGPSPAAPAASGNAPSSAPPSTAGNGAASTTPPPAASNGAPSSTPPAAGQRVPPASNPPAASDPGPSSSTPQSGAGGVTETGTAGPGWEWAPGAQGASKSSDIPAEIVPEEATSAPAPVFEADDAAPITVTPEPPTLVLLLSGVLAFLFLQRRRRTA
jgi:hypothetical protein